MRRSEPGLERIAIGEFDAFKGKIRFHERPRFSDGEDVAVLPYESLLCLLYPVQNTIAACVGSVNGTFAYTLFYEHETAEEHR